MLQANCAESSRAACPVRVPVGHSIFKAMQGAGSGHAAPGWLLLPFLGPGEMLFLVPRFHLTFSNHACN